MVAAELVAELLTQVVLRPARARIRRRSVRLNPRTLAAGGRLLRPGDEFLFAHQGQDYVAALERTVVVGQGEERRVRAGALQ